MGVFAVRGNHQSVSGDVPMAKPRWEGGAAAKAAPKAKQRLSSWAAVAGVAGAAAPTRFGPGGVEGHCCRCRSRAASLRRQSARACRLTDHPRHHRRPSARPPPRERANSCSSLTLRAFFLSAHFPPRRRLAALLVAGSRLNSEVSRAHPDGPAAAAPLRSNSVQLAHLKPEPVSAFQGVARGSCRADTKWKRVEPRRPCLGGPPPEAWTGERLFRI